MKETPELVATFLAHARVRVAPPADVNAFEELLRQAVETCRARWPDVELPAVSFVRHLAERLPDASPGSAPEPLLAQVPFMPELYLACACGHGISTAIARFEREYLARLPGVLGSLKQPAAMIDDICQETRVRILVRTPEGAPRITEYTGRGSLSSWVRVIAGRIALKRSAAARPTAVEDADAVFDALPAPGFDTELDLIKRRHHSEFRQAVRGAFSALSSDERHLLRLAFVDRLSTTDMGTLFRVNQTTAARWLKAARQKVYDETRQRLQARLGLSSAEFQSFLTLLDSQLDLSISQLFGEEGEPRDAAHPKAADGEPGPSE